MKHLRYQIKDLCIFLLLIFVITAFWQLYEFHTLGRLNPNNKDTIIAILLAIIIKQNCFFN